MDIDEAITHAEDIYMNCEDIDCAFEHVQLANWLKELKGLKAVLGNDHDLDRIKELIQADKEGRCVILPCKVGDIVYQITRNFISEFKVSYIGISTYGNIFIHTSLLNGIIISGEVFPFTRIGEDLYFSYIEAEQALKERKSE